MVGHEAIREHLEVLAFGGAMDVLRQLRYQRRFDEPLLPAIRAQRKRIGIATLIREKRKSSRPRHGRAVSQGASRLRAFQMREAAWPAGRPFMGRQCQYPRAAEAQGHEAA